MDWPALLIIIGLAAAAVILLGLWVQRRPSSAVSSAMSPRTPAVVLRASGSRLVSGDDNVEEEARTQSIVLEGRGSMGAGPMTAVVSAEPAPNCSEVALPSRISDGEEVRQGKDAPHETAQLVGAPAVPIAEGGKMASTDGDLSPTDEDEPIPEISKENPIAEADGLIPRAAGTANRAGITAQLALRAVAAVPEAPALVADIGPVDPIPEGISNDPSGGAEQKAAPSAESHADECEASVLVPSAAEDLVPESAVQVEPESNTDAIPQPPSGPAIRLRRSAVHRDRRGKRRTVGANEGPKEPAAAAPELAVRPPAEAKLRLSLHPIRRTVRLSVVLTRPDGFPVRVTVEADGSHTIQAYDERRYDDLDLPWTTQLLDGELRLVSADGFQWLRSARQVHIFAEDPNEPELISVSAARAGTAHTLVFRSGDAEGIRLATLSTGSSELQALQYWKGIPDGWTVLSGYTPVQAATSVLPPSLRALDPGEGLQIGFDGGLAIRARLYAAGHPPRISITPAPGAASVTIDGKAAALSPDGTWIAPGWDVPGQHMVDVVPGPSASYEIAPDPWMSGGWDFWDAYPDRFGNETTDPWAQARICGALIRGPAAQTVFAAETQSTLVALGARSGAAPLRRRDDLAVSVGLLAEPPAFLLSTAGPRRTQGRIVWLGLAPVQNISRRYDAEWVATVRSAAARRLPLEWADALGKDAWRKAKERARRLRSKRARA